MLPFISVGVRVCVCVCGCVCVCVCVGVRALSVCAICGSKIFSRGVASLNNLNPKPYTLDKFLSADSHAIRQDRGVDSLNNPKPPTVLDRQMPEY